MAEIFNRYAKEPVAGRAAKQAPLEHLRGLRARAFESVRPGRRLFVAVWTLMDWPRRRQAELAPTLVLA